MRINILKQYIISKFSNISIKIKKINNIIKLIIIVFVALILTIILLRPINTVSLDKRQNSGKANIDNIYEKKIIDNSNQIQKQLDDNQILYLPLEDDNNADDCKEVQKRLSSWRYETEDNKKIAYLTFDDGPSKYITDKILDILSEKDVKATFFILGSKIHENNYAKEALKRIAREGHAIGNHGFCHRYDVLYPGNIVNVDNFISDMKKSEYAMKEVLGESFSTNVIRFPGGHGSWDTSAIDQVLQEKGYTYIDWNTLNGDGENQGLTPQHLLNRLKQTINDLQGNDDVIVVLMHDTDEKESTAQYLSNAIDYLRSQGYEFKTLK